MFDLLFNFGNGWTSDAGSGNLEEPEIGETWLEGSLGAVRKAEHLPWLIFRDPKSSIALKMLAYCILINLENAENYD